MSRISADFSPLSPLEQFVRDYTERREGAWEEIEPGVYDLLIGPELHRVAFDPEALPEHPQAQLASLGAPLLDRLLSDACRRWQTALFHRVGLNLHPRNLDQTLRRAVSLPAGWNWRIDSIEPMNFPQAVFWFKAGFTSDQKEEDILPLGIDLHYLREVRRLDDLIAADRLSDSPPEPLPLAPQAGLSAGYHAARDCVVRTVSALANARRRQWAGHIDRQIARMTDYYAQLRREAEEAADAADPARSIERIQSIDRERSLRIAELRQKSAMKVRLGLASLMIVMQPKLLITAAAIGKDRPVPLAAVWDPLTESIEAVACPHCHQPTFDLRGDRTLSCPACAGRPGRAIPPLSRTAPIHS